MLLLSTEMLSNFLANSVDPNQTAPTSDLGPHCFPPYLHKSNNDSKNMQQTTYADNIFR